MSKLVCVSASRLAPARSAITSSTTSGRRLATMARALPTSRSLQEVWASKASSACSPAARGTARRSA